MAGGADLLRRILGQAARDLQVTFTLQDTISSGRVVPQSQRAIGFVGPESSPEC
jgi:hypothetical protein